MRISRKDARERLERGAEDGDSDGAVVVVVDRTSDDDAFIVTAARLLLLLLLLFLFPQVGADRRDAEEDAAIADDITLLKERNEKKKQEGERKRKKKLNLCLLLVVLFLFFSLSFFFSFSLSCSLFSPFPPPYINLAVSFGTWPSSSLSPYMPGSTKTPEPFAFASSVAVATCLCTSALPRSSDEPGERS